MHAVGTYRTQQVDVQQFMLNGLPTCKFCLTRFATWRNFTIHVERGCQALFAGPLATTLPSLSSTTTVALRSGKMPSAEEILRGTRVITSAELAHLKQQEWGEALLILLDDRVPERISRNQTACHYLARHCILCGQFVSRTQEMLAHLRQTHADLAPLIPERCIQLINLHCNDSPCEYCGAAYKNHTCPVWLQLSVLILHGAGIHASHAEPLQQQLRCQICLELLTTAAELTQHLQTVHGLAGLTFNSARDCMTGTETSPACTHCGSIHSSLEGLRSHIVKGRCRHFNPDACTENQPVSMELQEACLSGRLLDLLSKSMQKLHLTLQCACCGRKYDRAADLACHLQVSHARLWRLSKGLVQALTDTVYQQRGCCCNPQTGQKRASHVCLPLRQIAMAFFRLGQEPFLPFPIQESAVPQLIAHNIESTLRFKLEQVLSGGTLSQPWQDDDLRCSLSTTCLQCGALHAAPELGVHLREVHICQHASIQFYMEQLMPVLLGCCPDDYRCVHCQQIFNLPPQLVPDSEHQNRKTLAQSHLLCHCPCLLQISVLLASVLNGGRIGYDGAGFTTGDSGHLSGAPNSARQFFEAVSRSTQPQETQGARPGKRRRRGAAGPQSPGAEPDATHGSSTGAQTRAGDHRMAPIRHIHAVLQQGATNRHTPDPGQGNPELEGTTGDQDSGHHASASAPAESPADGPPQPGHQDLQEFSRGRGGAPDETEGTADRGTQLALSPMGSQSESTPPNLQEARHYGQADAAPGGATGDGAGSDGHCPFPRPESSVHTGRDSVAPSDLPEAGRAMGPPDAADLQQHVGADWHNLQSALTSTQSIGSVITDDAAHPDEERHRQGEERRLQTEGMRISLETTALWMMHLILQNSDNWCFANCTFYCAVWALVCFEDASLGTRGDKFGMIQQFLHRTAGQLAALESELWFRQLVRFGGFELGQNDVSEFTNTFVEWLGAPAIDLSWARRVQNGDIFETSDSGSRHMPLVLQFDSSHNSTGHCTLQDLVVTWHQVQGQKAALLTATPILCVQLDRMYNREGGTVGRNTCAVDMVADVRFPCFTGEGLDCEHAQYVIVAAAAHFGQDGAGHCRAVIRVRPTVTEEINPFQWLLTQDNMAPAPVWQVPTWMREHLTSVWLLRADCLQLPTHGPLSPHAPSQREIDMQAMFTMLTALPGIET